MNLVRLVIAAVAVWVPCLVAAAQSTPPLHTLVGRTIDARVVRIADGDTLELVPAGQRERVRVRLEGVDGWHWRSPELASSVLERKFAYAFAARAAGNIEWAWNINP